MQDLLRKRLIDYTGEDLVELLNNYLKFPEDKTPKPKDFKKFVYGLAGIAELFGCSKTSANRIKQSGKIDGAITQFGNTIVCDVQKALELAGKKDARIKPKK